MIIVVFMRPFRLSVEVEVILNCDSFTPPPSVIRLENLPQMQH